MDPVTGDIGVERLRGIVEELKSAQLDEEIGDPFVYSLLSSMKMGSTEIDELAVEVFDQLRKRKILTWFGAFEAKGLTTKQKSVSIETFAENTGIPLSALAPKKSTISAWQFAGVGTAIGIMHPEILRK